MPKWILVPVVILLTALCIFAILRGIANDTIPDPTVLETIPVSTAPSAPEETLPTAATQATVPPRVWQQPDPEYTLKARNAFVYDCDSGELLFHLGEMDAQIAPASLTKLLTAYVALEYLQPETVITCGEETTWISSASSVAWVGPGDRLSVEMLVQGMMMQSGNDAAYAVAVAAGRVIAGDAGLSAREALAVFMERVNSRGEELGLTGTHFETPDGLDTWKHYTTPGDMLRIALLVMEQPLLLHYTSITQGVVMYENGESYQYKSTNFLLHPESEYYCPDACGMKTGTTKKAGSCLMALFHNGEGYILIGVFGCPEYEDRFSDALQLYALYGEPK